ncbi:uncharacterized protein VTP21DRAFT_9596 [Calcarisporiella thermophila]|uniref:uncharacterized protein n=1 Tax=Calcarisporiella thermophila TaxID=911321 RepID=UPI003742B5C2
MTGHTSSNSKKPVMESQSAVADNTSSLLSNSPVPIPLIGVYPLAFNTSSNPNLNSPNQDLDRDPKTQKKRPRRFSWKSPLKSEPSSHAESELIEGEKKKSLPSLNGPSKSNRADEGREESKERIYPRKDHTMIPNLRRSFGTNRRGSNESRKLSKEKEEEKASPTIPLLSPKKTKRRSNSDAARGNAYPLTAPIPPDTLRNTPSELIQRMSIWLYSSRVVQYIARAEDHFRLKTSYSTESIWLLGVCYRFDEEQGGEVNLPRGGDTWRLFGFSAPWAASYSTSMSTSEDAMASDSGVGKSHEKDSSFLKKRSRSFTQLALALQRPSSPRALVPLHLDYAGGNERPKTSTSMLSRLRSLSLTKKANGSDSEVSSSTDEPQRITHKLSFESLRNRVRNKQVTLASSTSNMDSHVPNLTDSMMSDRLPSEYSGNSTAHQSFSSTPDATPNVSANATRSTSGASSPSPIDIPLPSRNQYLSDEDFEELNYSPRLNRRTRADDAEAVPTPGTPAIIVSLADGKLRQRRENMNTGAADDVNNRGSPQEYANGGVEMWSVGDFSNEADEEVNFEMELMPTEMEEQETPPVIVDKPMSSGKERKAEETLSQTLKENESIVEIFYRGKGNQPRAEHYEPESGEGKGSWGGVSPRKSMGMLAEEEKEEWEPPELDGRVEVELIEKEGDEEKKSHDPVPSLPELGRQRSISSPPPLPSSTYMSASVTLAKPPKPPTGPQPPQMTPNQGVLLDFLADFRSRIGLTYRKDFSRICPTSFYTTDIGWGCMHRTSQSMLANALLHHFLGRGWRRHLAVDRDKKDSENWRKYVEIVSWFLDVPDAPFSIHRMTQRGQELGKNLGEWFGPSTTSLAIKAMLKECDKLGASVGMGVVVAGDGVIYRDEVVRCSHEAVPSTQPSSSKTSERDDDNLDDEVLPRPVLVLAATRLGVEGVNPVYYQGIMACFRFPQSVGIAGGRPSASLYFVGYQGGELLYIDPHLAQPAATSTEDSILHTFHHGEPRAIPISQIDPSMLLGFYIRDSADFKLFCSQVEEVASHCTPVVSIMPRAPHYSDGGSEDFECPEKEMSGRKEGEGEEEEEEEEGGG